MEITFAKAETIFNTIPIGYYLGRRIDITLSQTSGASYYDPFTDKIVISYPTIAQTIQSIPTILSNDEIEEIIRGLVYHEVSHVILTPKDLLARDAYMEAVNILEDERIETLCRTMYMNTNFRKLVRLINNYHDEKATDAKTAFYHLVRFHKGEEAWLDRLHNLIADYRKVNAATDNYYLIHEMREAYIAFYNDFMADYKENNPEDNTSSEDENSDNNDMNNTMTLSFDNSDDTDEENNTDTSSDMDDTDDTNSEDTEENISNKAMTPSNTEEEETESSNPSTETEDKEEEKTEDTEKVEDTAPEFDDIELDKDTFAKMSEKVFNIYYDRKLEERLHGIINAKLRQKTKNGSAISSYSGRLNVRAIGTREDYKWWAQQNRAGHIRQFSKVHFNLFIDNSGSFRDNDERMNTFIRTLDRVNLPDFSFDIITINTKIDEWNDHNQRFYSHSGNKLLASTIGPVVKKHQKPATNNINIVLFDGDAHSDDMFYYSSSYEENPKEDGFISLDRNDTIIITDSSNEEYINKSKVSRAKVKYIRSNYASQFIDTVCDMLEVML